MTATKSLIFRFADVEVREAEFRLIKAGETLAVEPKAFRVLVLLLRSPQRVITKEELLDAVWADTAVTENSLARTILKLRRLLEEDPREPRYIETVATVGYRFGSRVEVFEDVEVLEAAGRTNGRDSVDLAGPHSNGHGAGASDAPAVELFGSPIPATIPIQAEHSHRRSSKRRWLFAASLLAVGLAASVWYLRRPLPMFHVSRYTQITHDGRRKVPLGTDGVRLYLNEYPDPNPPSQVAVSGGEVARIPIALPNAFMADVSSDGSTLVVTSRDERTSSIWSVPVVGTSLRHLTDGDIVTGAFSPDGKSVIWATSDGEIEVMQRDGGGAHRLVNVPYRSANFFFERIAWSPDGSTIRFDRNNKIYEIKPDGSGFHQFLAAWRPGSAQCCGQWTPNGDFFLFLQFDPSRSTEAGMQPATQIWALDERRGLFRRAAEPVQLTSGPTRWGRPIPGKDGKNIFAMGASQNGELVRVDAKSHELLPYLGGKSVEGVSFSSDGRFMAYVTFPEGILWRANRDGTNPVQLTDPPLYPTLPCWSPDGAEILFSAGDSAFKMKSYIVSSQGGTPRPILPEDKEGQENSNWSPDGRKIVFATSQSLENPAKPVIRILDLATHAIDTVPQSDGISNPRWSPDGRSLAGLGDDSLNVYDFEKRHWSVLQKGPIGYPVWSRNGRYLYYLRVMDDKTGVYRIRPTGGEAERVVDLRGFRFTSVLAFWMGLDPDDMPMLLRDVGGIDIYALTLEQK